MGLFITTTRYTLRSTRWEVRQVQCEECHEHFLYDLKRHGLGQQSSSFAVSNKAARDEAQEDAQWELQRQLKQGFDCVPCPTCGHYQRYMVTHLRRQHWGWLRLPGWAAMIIGLILCGALLAPASKRDRVLVTVGALISSGMAILGGRWLLARRFDPNAGSPEARKAAARQRTYRPEDAARLQADRQGDRVREPLRLHEYTTGRSILPWTVLAVLPCLAGLALFASAALRIERAKESANWPKVHGKIVSTTKIEPGPRRRRSVRTTTDVVYGYEVDGKAYRSNQIRFVLSEDAELLYTEGMDVFVHYDPANPANAVLLPGFKAPNDYVLFAIPTAILCVGLCLAGVAAKKYNRYRGIVKALRPAQSRQTWREAAGPRRGGLAWNPTHF